MAVTVIVLAVRRLVAHRLPGFVRSLLERAAQARRDHGDSDTIPIAGLSQPGTEQRARERDLSERPTGQLRHSVPRPGSVHSVR